MEADHRRAVFLQQRQRRFIKRATPRIGGNICRRQAETGEVRCEQRLPGDALRLAHLGRAVREEIDVIRRLSHRSANGGKRRVQRLCAIHRRR